MRLAIAGALCVLVSGYGDQSVLHEIARGQRQMYIRYRLARVSESQKVRRSPDWSLQLDSMKSESLVIVNQNVTVNTFPGLVHTARHTMGVDCSRSS